MSSHGPTAVPIRIADDWEETVVDGERRVTIAWTKSARNRIDRFLFDLFGTSREREITLDPVGTTVWRHCDGDHTVSEIASAVADAHDAERVEPVDETLAHFLMQLEERDLIQFEDD
ncbi:PqqD family protein [Natrinema salifodinae]|uniref:Coenzyme PQQ synthesis protein D (PqqD) n=1 Tax=Natrinema salifodinae TaxID=1202768 RepID=A0A1I0N2M7_9EURY|nr:PqqD family protein [Natrinema salifodinae]SEV95340.1 Coenzyme PQQ synthesis protein D (PqqD) [Natrinema salifodinae]